MCDAHCGDGPSLPLPVLRERVGVRVIWNIESRCYTNTPTPLPTPGVPGEGVEAIHRKTRRRHEQRDQ
jgi:hypothetical protein